MELAHSCLHIRKPNIWVAGRVGGERAKRMKALSFPPGLVVSSWNDASLTEIEKKKKGKHVEK